jgi:hypothetical protein
VTVLPVPPVCIRPSVEMDGASNEDDITMKLMVGWSWGLEVGAGGCHPVVQRMRGTVLSNTFTSGVLAHSD